MKKILPVLATFFFFLAADLMAHSPSVPASKEHTQYHVTSPGVRGNQITEISYSVEPFYDLNAFRLIVVLEFKGDKSGETKIILPGGADYNSIKYLKAISQNSYISDTENATEKIVKHQPGAPVRIYYQVEEIRDEDLEIGNQQLASINRQYFHFLGESFFIVPDLDDKAECNFRIAWNHLPPNWSIANSLGVNEQYQVMKLPMWSFRHTAFIGGDFKIRTRYIGNYPVFIAIRGSWKFSEDQFCDLVRDIVIEERNFWVDHNIPYYLLSVAPVSGSDEQTGIVRLNSYSLFLTKDRILDLNLKRLLAHDLFHSWIGEKVRFADPEQLVLWFKEGFTDYYTDVILLRAKLITLEQYIEHYNLILESYFTSPMREEKNERLIDGFGTDRDLTRLPYQRGQIFAHNLNFAIMKNSNWKKSLDDLMRDLLARCLNESLVISNGSLSALIRFYAGDQILSEIMRTLNSGAVLKTHPDALGPCFKMEIDSRKRLIIFGEQYDIPSYKLKNENQPLDKNCLNWFRVD